MTYHIKKWEKESAPKAADLCAEMEREGYHVFQWRDGPDQTYEKHAHGEDQSHWIISGKLELAVENFGTVLLQAGDRDFMPAGTVHAARVIGDEPVVYLIGVKR